VGALGILWGIAADRASAQTSYRIEPQDQLNIEVWEKPDLTRIVAVRADGTVTLPLIGEVQVGGTTPAELEEELARNFSLYDRQITQISVEVTAYNSKAVFVLGEVAQPGKYASWPMPTIWDLVRDAGGPTENAYLGGVQVIRQGGTAGERNILTVDLNQIWGRGVPTSLPELEPDDTVIVPKKVIAQTWPNVIYLFGGVQKPGVYQKEAAIDLAGAVLLAGGPSGRGDLREITIVRRGPDSPRTIMVNMENFLKHGDEVSNPILVEGDTITVKERGPTIWGMNTIRAVATLVGLTATIILLADRLKD
jgi:polysaccharide export outer membrane protein